MGQNGEQHGHVQGMWVSADVWAGQGQRQEQGQKWSKSVSSRAAAGILAGPGTTVSRGRTEVWACGLDQGSRMVSSQCEGQIERGRVRYRVKGKASSVRARQDASTGPRGRVVSRALPKGTGGEEQGQGQKIGRGQDIIQNRARAEASQRQGQGQGLGQGQGQGHGLHLGRACPECA